MTAAIVTGRFEYHRPTTPPPAPEPVFIRTFEGRPGIDWSALNEAQDYLRARGFSYGPTCVSHKSGVMYGRGWHIAKWRNLTPLEQHQCHGVIESKAGDSWRHGPLTLRIYYHAPAFAIAAIASAVPDGAAAEEVTER